MRVISAAVLAAVLATASAAQAGYGAAQWGMTPEQVVAAVPGAKLKKGDKLENKRALSAGVVVDGERRYDAEYYYDAAGLAEVHLKVKRRWCEGLYKDLVAAHGQPMRTTSQVIMRSAIWHDPASDSRLTLTLLSRGDECWLVYYRLGDYRAIDEQLAAEGR